MVRGVDADALGVQAVEFDAVPLDLGVEARRTGDSLPAMGTLSCWISPSIRTGSFSILELVCLTELCPKSEVDGLESSHAVSAYLPCYVFRSRDMERLTFGPSRNLGLSSHGIVSVCGLLRSRKLR